MSSEINSESKLETTRTVVSYYEKSSLIFESNEDEYNNAKKNGINEPFSINFKSSEQTIQLEDILVNSADMFIDGLKDAIDLIIEDIKKDRLQKPIHYDYAKFKVYVFCKSDDIMQSNKIQVEMICKNAIISFTDNSSYELNKDETPNLLL